jgi:hypothetical protein
MKGREGSSTSSEGTRGDEQPEKRYRSPIGVPTHGTPCVRTLRVRHRVIERLFGALMSTYHRARPGRRHLLRLSLVLALFALSAGCDGATDAIEGVASSEPDVEEDPAAALRDAVAALEDWKGIAAEVRIETDAAARANVIVADDLSEEEVEFWLASSLVVRAGDVGDPDAAGLETSIIVGGDTVFDLRVTGDERFFVRLDLDRLSELSKRSELAERSEDAEILDVDELLVAARMFGLGDVALAASEGRWVELIGIDDVMDLAGDEPAEEPEIDDAELDALTERLSTTFQRFVNDDVEVAYVGDDDPGERVRIVTDGASLEALVAELTSDLDRAGLLEDVAGENLDDLDIDDDQVVTVDAWIDGGELRQLGFDPSTFDDAKDLPGEILVLITLDEFTGSVQAPDDAEPFDVLSTFGAFFGGMGSDPFGDRDALFDEAPFEDDEAFDEDGACITDEELAELEEFAGADAAAEFEALIDAGFLERC